MTFYPYVSARWSYPSRLRPIRLAIVHTAETLERSNSAENLAQWFSYTDVKVSAHLAGDDDSIVRCLPDSATAFAAPGANADGLQFELAGRAIQNLAEWNDPFSRAAVARMAKAFADWCQLYSLPVVKLSPAEVRAGARGICGHHDVTLAYGGSHWDPGAYFPWDRFIADVKDILQGQPTGGEVTVMTGNRLDVFARGIDGALWHQWYKVGDLAWHDWESLGGQIKEGTMPGAAPWETGVVVTVTGTDDQRWEIRHDGSTWSGWEARGGVLTSGPAVVTR